MSKNPFLNALSASSYIVLVTAIINFASQSLSGKPDSFFAPVIFMSLLTLSVAVMAYLFFYQPLQLFIQGKKKESVDLFVKTTLFFAIFTIIFLVLLFSGLI